MAYNNTERFSRVEHSFPLLDPGSYQNVFSLNTKPNKVPFLSKSPRKTQISHKVWTHTVYYHDAKEKIPNCTSISSKTPRFSYEKWCNDKIAENIVQNTCQCGVHDSCECHHDDEKYEEYQNAKEPLCQAKFQRKLFKGTTLKPLIGDTLSCPLKKDHGLSDSSQIRVLQKKKEVSPKFYDARVIESNSFYRGCKWSRRTSQRANKSTTENLPGPADYNVYGMFPSYEANCIEKLRAFKRKTAQQLRYLDKVQRQNILEHFPGPANYSPTFPKDNRIHFLGPKAERFKSLKNNEIPGPTRYFVKRDLDVPDPLNEPCLAKLPVSAPFGVRDSRFKYNFKKGPSPASYDLHDISCRITSCRFPSFGSTAARFNDRFIEENIDEDINNAQDESANSKFKKRPTWEFRSKTTRMKPLTKKLKEPSPADLPQSSVINKRSPHSQHTSPFYSSEPRFRYWHNWIPIQGSETTQGPSYYNPEKIKCLPSVKSGPLYRSKRFTSHALETPAPNEYRPKNEIEYDILNTFNQNLKNNIAKKHTFHWKYTAEKRILSKEEQELLLLNKTIALLDVPDIFKYEKPKSEKIATKLINNKPTRKLLRYFMYAHQVKPYF